MHWRKGEEMKVNARKETQLRSDVTGQWLELDIWFPQLNLAFEYQVSLPPFFLCSTTQLFSFL
jgi:hypothetical protein